MITETMINILKLVVISVSATLLLFMLTDMNYMTSIYYRIKYVLFSVPGVKPLTEYLANIFLSISSIFATIYDKINHYALPSNPVSDTYHM